MLEVVFSDSACGGLKYAQHYGEGPYRPGCIGVIFSQEDGEPTPAEIEAAQRRAEEAERLAWERAVLWGQPGGRAGHLPEPQRRGTSPRRSPGPSAAPPCWSSLASCPRRIWRPTSKN